MLLLLVAVVATATSLDAYDYQYRATNMSYGYSDRIVFPDQIPPTNQLVKSLILAQRMNSLQNREDFLKLFKIYPAAQSYSPVLVVDRIGGDERSSKVITAKQAVCVPEMQVVPVIVEDPDPSETYFPTCVRMKRCGGCCNHPLLSCQPTATETRNYEIDVLKLGADLPPKNHYKKIVPLDEHIRCKCSCTTKEKDCSDKQYYLEDECRCICKNPDEEFKCQQQNQKKYWNPNNCSCDCRNVEECPTGSYFDQNLCSCQSIYSEQWLNESRTGYNSRQPGKPKESPPVIVTLDASDPRRKHKEDPEYK